jgi:S-adenosylmethionine hydrolase
MTHDISPHLIREAAVTIGMCYQYFPSASIHVCVVDPGVGSGRRPILIATDNHYFVGPDNGIFSYIYSTSKNVQVIHITEDHYFEKKDSTTFHARDIFSAIAAWLSKGIPIENFGKEIKDYVNLNLPLPHRHSRDNLEGEVIYIDRFGNAITNISVKHLGNISRLELFTKARILCKSKQIALKPFYSDVHDKELYAILNSNDLLELFVYRGNASVSFELKIGDTVGIVIQ